MDVLSCNGGIVFQIPPANIRGALAAASLVSALTDALNAVACVVATAVVVALACPLFPYRSCWITLSMEYRYDRGGAAWLDWDPLGTPTGTEERISACGHPYYGTEEHIDMAIPTNSDSKAEGLALLRLEHNRRAMNEYYIV
jgi:hypothetical protein